MVAFLEGLEADGSLDSTALFILGDHGHRVEKIKDTTVGR